MTPTETKANELIEHFAETIPAIEYGVLLERNCIAAKQCAIICVKEIIEALPDQPSVGNSLEFWNDVLNNLKK